MDTKQENAGVNNSNMPRVEDNAGENVANMPHIKHGNGPKIIQTKADHIGHGPQRLDKVEKQNQSSTLLTALNMCLCLYSAVFLIQLIFLWNRTY